MMKTKDCARRGVTVFCSIAVGVLVSVMGFSAGCQKENASEKAGREAREAYEKSKDLLKEGLDKTKDLTKDGLQKSQEAAKDFQKGWKEGGK